MNRPARARRAISLAALAIASAVPGLVQAAGWPSQPVHVIITYPPGGGADMMGRLVANKLSELTGQPFVVENRPGAGGQIGAAAVSKAPADGYTLLFDASAYATNPSLYSKLPYDPLKAFVPLGIAAMFPNVLVVTPNFPAKSVQELIAMAKAKPGSLSFASSGNGASQHLAGVLFAEKLGLQMTHVPYRGGGPAMVDVMGGQVPMIFANVASSLTHIRGGKLRPLATTGAKRPAQLPDIPTMSETVIPGYEVYEWNALFAPAGTPAPVMKAISEVVKKALAAEDFRKTVAEQGGEVGPDNTADAARFIQKEMTLWSQVIRDNKIRLD